MGVHLSCQINSLTKTKGGHETVPRELNKWKQLCKLKCNSVTCLHVSE